jgi:hypothetical protein
MTDAPPTTTKLYWYLVAGGAVISVVAAAAINAIYVGVMDGGLSVSALPSAVRAGLIFGLLTTAFVILGTVRFASKLRFRKGWAIVLSVVAPVVGWTLFGAIDSGFGPTSLFAFYPVVGVIAGAGSGLVAALASFLVPEATSHRTPASPDSADLEELLSREG